MLGSLRSMCLALSSIPFGPFSQILAPPPRLVYQFPPGVLLENLAARPNGHLLLTAINTPYLYTINPQASTPAPQIVYEFPNASGLTGVAPTRHPDIFAVIAGIWNLDYTGVLGSFSIWKVDFSRSDPPVVTEWAPIPETSSLNGLAVIPESTEILLASDSALGTIWAFNSRSRKVTKAFHSDLFGPNETFPLGINGINTRKSQGKYTLHFANSAQDIYGVVPIRNDGSKAGDIKILANLDIPERYDDFAVDSQGTALIAAHPGTIYRVSLDGIATLYMNSSLILDPTSSTFGKGSVKEESTLYISTDGRGPNGGQVIAIDDYSPEPPLARSRWFFGRQHVLH